MTGLKMAPSAINHASKELWILHKGVGMMWGGGMMWHQECRMDDMWDELSGSWSIPALAAVEQEAFE
jgi:hypothetical protein